MIATAVDETEDWHCGTVRAKITMKIAMMVADGFCRDHHGLFSFY